MEYSYRINTKKTRNEGQLTTSFIALILAICTFVNSASCKSTRINGHIVTTESEHAYNEPQGDYDEAEFDWELSTDNVEVYDLIRATDLETIIVKFLEKSSTIPERPSTRRYKRSFRTAAAHTKDNRKPVSPSIDGQIMPYVASVKISSGCSGTLVGPKHVLTAAHCAFRGIKKTTKRKLKVGFLQRSGRVRWRKVRKVHAPSEWRSLKTARLKYDYAILELKREHGRSFMNPVVFGKNLLRSRLQFNGFPFDKKVNTMWHARCKVHQYLRGYPINNCFVTKGMSGSGAYHRTSGSYNVMGVLAATLQLTTRDKRKFTINYINPLTRAKRMQICKWMKAGKDCKRSKR